MLKIKKDTSAHISMVLAFVALAALAIAAVAAPFVMKKITDSFDGLFPDYARSLIFVYSAMIPVITADVMLISLLFLVRRREVFTPGAVARLRGISWCCFAECAILIAEGFAFGVAFIGSIITISFIAAFLGIVLRVVKNVLEEATAIKSENDFTI